MNARRREPPSVPAIKGTVSRAGAFGSGGKVVPMKNSVSIQPHPVKVKPVKVQVRNAVAGPRIR